MDNHCWFRPDPVEIRQYAFFRWMVGLCSSRIRKTELQCWCDRDWAMFIAELQNRAATLIPSCPPRGGILDQRFQQEQSYPRDKILVSVSSCATRERDRGRDTTPSTRNNNGLSNRLNCFIWQNATRNGYNYSTNIGETWHRLSMRRAQWDILILEERAHFVLFIDPEGHQHKRPSDWLNFKHKIWKWLLYLRENILVWDRIHTSPRAWARSRIMRWTDEKKIYLRDHPPAYDARVLGWTRIFSI